MAKIVPKLNLNKTPQIVEPYSMIFAKNIKLLKDNTIGRDDGIDIIPQSFTTHNGIEITENNLVGFIPYNTIVFFFYNKDSNSFIFKYDEELNRFTEVECNWNWSGGKIDGKVNINLRNETLLSINEYFENDSSILVPFKTINLNEASYDDDESIYTQTPNLNIVNFHLIGSYTNVIPNGVYQFFVRYEIKPELYTNWIPVSKECFTSNIYENDTVQGTVRYMEVTEDSNNSFIFHVEKLTNYADKYKYMQVGFILSNKDTVVARSWKKFNTNVETIYFDYDKDYIEELDVTDFLNPVFSLNNVKNITSFKNKLYISNYIESNYNEDLNKYSKDWHIEIRRTPLTTESNYTYRNLRCDITEITDGNENKINLLYKIGTIEIADWLKDKATDFFKFGSNEMFVAKKEVQDSSNPVTTPVEDEQHQPIIVTADSLTEAESKFNDLLNRVDHAGIKRNTLISNLQLYIKYEPDTRYDIAYDNKKVYTDNVVQGQDTTWYAEVGRWLTGSIRGFDIKTSEAVYSTKEDSEQSRDHLILTYDKSDIKVTKVDNNQYKAAIVTETCNIKYTLKLQAEDLVSRGEIDDFNQTTLIPFQSYKFYIHYIKVTGETTNGYYVGSVDVDYDKNCDIRHDIIYPEFKHTENAEFPKGYVGYFFSIYKYKNTVAECFNGRLIKGKDNKRYCTFDCLEIDTLQLPLYNHINVVIPNSTYNTSAKFSAHYIDSGDVNKSLPSLFGASGKVVLDTENPGIDLPVQAFIVIENTKNEENVILVKCTPYYKFDKHIVEDFSYYNLINYICKVSKNVINETELYINSDSGYNKKINYDENEKPQIDLTPLDTYISTDHTDSIYIYSTFNLNFLELTNDIKNPLRSYKDTNGKTKYQILNAFESLTLSDLYTHPSMYKNYTRRTFSVYDKDAIVKFDNTLRSSTLEGDEAKTYIYRFAIEDYYNVPTDKGRITNLQAVGDIVIVHTQDSIFKFNGKPSLSNNDSQVQTNESDIFDTGIAEIVGSQHGYGGLRHKNNSLLCQYGYIYWDADANVIYFYAGEGELAAISDPISKLINQAKIDNIAFCCDYYNDRFFININYEDSTYATLSYNIKAKSFVSLHDFTFVNTFNTKTRTYFINNKHVLGYLSDNIHTYGRDTDTTFYDSNELYPFKSLIEKFGNYAIVDFICNDNYEIIKTLDSISWICNEVNDTFDNNISNPINKINLAEEILNRKYPGDFVTIYSDSSATELTDIIEASNDYALYKKLRDGKYEEVKEEEREKTNKISNSYKLPRYNLGKWSLNYFRNILNTENKTNVPSSTLGYAQDQQSLIYGKYFIVRFLFNPYVNFKFENLTFNISNNYGNA